MVNVEHAVAILAALGAMGMAEHKDDMLYLGIMVEHPARSSRSVVVCADEGQGVCQAARRLGCKSRNVGMGADMMVVFRKNQFRNSYVCIIRFEGSHIHQKSAELLFVLEQQGEDPPLLLRQLMPCSDLVHQQFLGFLAVIDRIVHLLAHQFVVLHQMMVRTLGEEERGEVEGIYQNAVEMEIVCVMVDEVMSADIIDLPFLQKLVQCRLGCLVKGGSVMT